jgi:hypothetical protein
VRQLHHQRIVDRHERVAKALADGRQQAGVDRGYPEGGVALPQTTVGAKVLLVAVDLTVAVAAAHAGEGFLLHLVGGLPERPKLLLAEDAWEHEQAVTMELVELLTVEHHPLLPGLR